MSDFDGLIDMLPISDIAKKLGIDENMAELAVKAAVPAIIGGLAANASKSKEGAKSLEGALERHSDKIPAGKAKVADIDTGDGKKIVKNVFGSKSDDVAEAVGEETNVAGDIIAQVLPIIAPIVLAWVGSQFFGAKAEPAAKPEAKVEEEQPAASGIDLGAMIGGLLSSKQGQDLIGGALAGMLGGGKK
ncbi:MAG: DUF937 domain-containing protein [Salinibacterium sp.]|nr:DUF937 domain-containing protein [Salinibacterium sp.]